jgi:hypothetical protein
MRSAVRYMRPFSLVGLPRSVNRQTSAIGTKITARKQRRDPVTHARDTPYGPDPGAADALESSLARASRGRCVS